MRGVLSKSLKSQVASIPPTFRRHGAAAFSSLAELRGPQLDVSSSASSSPTIWGPIDSTWAESYLEIPPKASSTVTKRPINRTLAKPHLQVPSKSSSAVTKKSIKHTLAEPHLKTSSFNIPKASYPTRSAAPIPSDPLEIRKIATQAVNDINAVYLSHDYEQLRSLFLTESCYWKDHLGLTSTQFVTLDGVNQIIPFVSQQLSREGRCFKNFSLENGKEPRVANLDPEGNIKCIQAFITFETEHAKGRGVVTLLRDTKDGDKWKVYMLFTNISELTGHPWKEGQGKERYAMPEDAAEGMNWKDWRDKKQDFTEEDPAVLVVGSGHSGLMVAARLGMLGVPTLIVDKGERVGDSWRNRYHRLTLHDPCWMNVMPYLDYPANWPVYASKDKMADFLEYYASALELNAWTQTQVIQSTWNEIEKRWTVVLERTVNGAKVRRTLYPRHLVQATGLNGEPRIPPIPGLDTFKGPVHHSSEFKMGTAQDVGKKVVIVGTGVSGHDIAYDLCKKGADVTLIQRSPGFIITLPSVLNMMKQRFNEDRPTEDSDLLAASMPTTVYNRVGGDTGKLLQKNDQPLLDGLASAGFALDTSQPALLSLTINRAVSFYIDAGASSLIASGAIKVKQAPSITSITPNGLVLNNKEEIEADQIFFATGYENGRVRTRKVFGDEVADKIQPIWGYDEMGEIRGVWRRSGHEAFWVAAGNFGISRYYSKLLALQIKMVEEGLVEL